VEEDNVNPPPAPAPVPVAPAPKLPNPVEEVVVGVVADFPNPKLVPPGGLAFEAAAVPKEKLFAGAPEEDAAGVEGAGVPNVKVITSAGIEIIYTNSHHSTRKVMYVGHTRSVPE
jgi:hypothetical protein